MHGIPSASEFQPLDLSPSSRNGISPLLTPILLFPNKEDNSNEFKNSLFKQATLAKLQSRPHSPSFDSNLSSEIVIPRSPPIQFQSEDINNNTINNLFEQAISQEKSPQSIATSEKQTNNKKPKKLTIANLIVNCLLESSAPVQKWNIRKYVDHQKGKRVPTSTIRTNLFNLKSEGVTEEVEGGFILIGEKKSFGYKERAQQIIRLLANAPRRMMPLDKLAQQAKISRNQLQEWLKATKYPIAATHAQDGQIWCSLDPDTKEEFLY